MGWLIRDAMDEEASEKDGEVEEAGSEEQACCAITGRPAAEHQRIYG